MPRRNRPNSKRHNNKSHKKPIERNNIIERYDKFGNFHIEFNSQPVVKANKNKSQKEKLVFIKSELIEAIADQIFGTCSDDNLP
jgi:hypothetical protein